MESIYLLCVGILFIIAIFDIMAGVSNDAVNFLQSAIGSRTASFRTLLVIAAIGIFIGASMSNGMMDIARHGIYQPQYFYFNEIMAILLAVMLTDVILLDVFNSLGLPTSTTVSMVFELLGGTFALAIIKVMSSDGALTLGQLINTDKALSVITAIFVSVALAFVCGSIVQFFARLLFRYNYHKQLKRWGALFSGFALTCIVYFIIFKGLKDSTIMTAENKAFIESNTMVILGCCMGLFTLLMGILQLCKVNVLKIVVLAGTFALALAFAGNDLVNFIGVPLAGYSAYNDFITNGNGMSPDSFLMTSLTESANTNPIFLIIAGLIMVIVLFTSNKVHRVVQTSIALSRQSAGEEGFGTSPLARQLVRTSIIIGNAISKITPQPVKNYINRRFDINEAILPDGAAYDLVRASINLVVASLLIALGTSLKLPLSTTYVTFMVAMGTSLADRAWGRESAVYRITGVISVIGGWFVTAGVAAFACFIVTVILHYGGFVAILILTAIVIYLIIHSQVSFNKKQKKMKEKELFDEQLLSNKDPKLALPLLRQHTKQEYAQFSAWCAEAYGRAIEGFFEDKSSALRKARHKVKNQRQALRISHRVSAIALTKLQEHDWIEKG
ncbi:MAG: inorganic phosphate transporter, partial [Bacteroidaceae bacterium]|nr:inorganic phosphate transporter [Bacteroidaceae bacterium]